MSAKASSGMQTPVAVIRACILGKGANEHLTGLLGSGFELLSCSDIEELDSAECLRESDIVLLDATQGTLDVLAALETIRARQALRHPAVVVVSANPDPGERDAACKACIDDYISWPVSGRELTVRIESALRLARPQLDDSATSRLNVDRFREMADNSPVMIWIANADGDVTFLNRTWSNFTGVTAQYALGLRWLDLLHPDDRIPTIDSYLSGNAAQGPCVLEYRMRRADGEYRWVTDTAAPYFDALGEYYGYIGSVTDISERKQIEEGLQRTRIRLEKQVEQRTAERDRIWQVSSELMAAVAWDGELKAINPAWTRTLGYSDTVLQSKRFQDFVYHQDASSTAEMLARIRRGESVTHFEHRMRHRDGSHRWIAWRAVPAEDTFYAVGRDITSEKERTEALQAAEAQLRQAQKMEAIGHLTGGVAHDFNNLLTVVIGNLDSIQRHLPVETSDRIVRAAQHAMQGAKRAANLTQRLLAFARQQPLDPKEIDINTLVRSMTDMLASTLGEDIDIHTALDADLWRAVVDPNQLENALLNLAVNARDAMPQGGKLTIETDNAVIDDAATVFAPDLRAGQYAVVAVSDTGVGMPRETLDRVFEPFFTTKASGHGTGLGLSQVYGFVTQSGGHVKIYSEPRVGTTVRLYLPRSISQLRLDDERSRATAPDVQPNESILVVEDEDSVRAYSCEVLRELGYRVVEAKDGLSGLQHLERDRSVAVLFTDVGLPGLNGRELAREARRLQPALKVLFTTGYAREAAVHQGLLDPGIAMINKPFTFADLATKVREVIDAA